MNQQASLADGLAQLAAALDAPEIRYEAVISAFRATPAIAPPVSPAMLSRAFHLAYRIVGITEGGPPMTLADGSTGWQAEHLTACARDLVERALHDQSRLYRISDATPLGYSDLDEPAAERLLAPFLARCVLAVEAQPTFHFILGWQAIKAGRAPFRSVVLDWIAALDGRGVGMPGTRKALADAAKLARDPPFDDFDDEGRSLLDLLHDPHVMRVAAAARRLGEWYGDHDEKSESAAPGLADMLRCLTALPRFRPSACGAFVSGFAELGSLGELFDDPRLPSDFDPEAFVLDVLALGDDEPYLPNAQSFWFYVHEYYDFDAAFVGRLIDAGHAYVALMCATEQNRKVEGMDANLERLARHEDAWIAAHAAQHLKAVYR